MWHFAVSTHESIVKTRANSNDLSTYSFFYFQSKNMLNALSISWSNNWNISSINFPSYLSWSSRNIRTAREKSKIIFQSHKNTHKSSKKSSNHIPVISTPNYGFDLIKLFIKSIKSRSHLVHKRNTSLLKKSMQRSIILLLHSRRVH